MKRLPLIPTIIVAAAVLTMIGLGVWQLQRAAWKEALLADYARAMALPAVDLDPLLASGRPLPELSFRRALVSCDARDVPVEARAGRNLADVTGQAFTIPCRPGASGPAGRLRINAGWATRPDAVRRLSLGGIVAGRLSLVEADGPITLTAATAAPPLVPSRPPGPDTIANNHMLYAWQWFFFAAAATVIYLLALRKRNRPRLPPEP
ncbi:MAG TPA: SURF1 family cytochrome oxidase biogenesis protein [Allosphingosinicella sp.]|nr:SURF1 family cytochrome oxidase biogenesis protein [Allosphingosinicella sp.]